MNQYRKLFKNTSLLFVGQFSSKLLTYFLLPIYTYVLTTEEYGTYDLIHVTATLLLPVLTADIFEACFRFAMDRETDKKQVFSWCLIFSEVAIVLALCLYPLIILAVGKEYYWMFFLVFTMSVLNTFLMQFVKGCEKLGAYSVFGIIHTGLLIVLNIVFLLVCKWGLYGYFMAHLVAYVIMVLICGIYIKCWRYIVSPSKLHFATLKNMISYSLPMIPNSICWWINNSADKYMVAAFLGNSWVGIYSVSYKVSSALSTVGSLFTSAFSISAIENHESDEAKDIYSQTYNAFFGAILCVASVLITLAPAISTIIFQKDFYAAWRSAIVLIIAFIFYSMAGYLGTIYVAAKKTKVLFFSTIASAVTNIVLNFVFMKYYHLGIYGAGIATSVSYFMIWLIRIIMVGEIIHFGKNTVVHILASIITVTQVFVMIYCDNFKYLICTALTLVVIALNFKSIMKMLKKILH